MYNTGWLAAHRGKGCQPDTGDARRAHGVLASMGLYTGGGGEARRSSDGIRHGGGDSADTTRCKVVALRYFDRAALQGNPAALFEAAKLYDSGTVRTKGGHPGKEGERMEVGLGLEGVTAPRPKVAVRSLQEFPGASKKFKEALGPPEASTALMSSKSC